jgi:hypothetical protein
VGEYGSAATRRTPDGKMPASGESVGNSRSDVVVSSLFRLPGEEDVEDGNRGDFSKAAEDCWYSIMGSSAWAQGLN